MIPYKKFTKEEKVQDGNHLKSIGILFRTILRMDKIEKIYGKNFDRKKR